MLAWEAAMQRDWQCAVLMIAAAIAVAGGFLLGGVLAINDATTPTSNDVVPCSNDQQEADHADDR